MLKTKLKRQEFIMGLKDKMGEIHYFGEQV
jgi:hypothetical protein